VGATRWRAAILRFRTGSFQASRIATELHLEP